jgi:hypothetical protein
MSYQQIHNIVSLATGTGAQAPVNIDSRRADWGPIPIQVFTTLATDFVGTIILEATVSTQQEVDEGTAVWSPITGASWTAETCDGLTTAFSWIRGNVTAYTSGSINVRALI